MPSSRTVSSGIRHLATLACLMAVQTPSWAYDPERDAWLLPEVEVELGRRTRPADAGPHPLDFSPIQAAGSYIPPEYAQGDRLALLDAAVRGDRERLETLLKQGENPNARAGYQGMTPLLHAVARLDVEMTRLLLAAGADPNLRGAGFTPLALAANLGQDRIAGYLLRAGADPDLKGSDGNTPLYHAALLGHTGVVREILSHGPDLALFNKGLPGFEGVNALGAAALAGNVAVLHLLLDAGADPGLLDRDMRPPLYYALIRHQRGSVRALLERGADPGVMSIDAY